MINPPAHLNNWLWYINRLSPLANGPVFSGELRNQSCDRTQEKDTESPAGEGMIVL
jgi:hypothetical protein